MNKIKKLKRKNEILKIQVEAYNDVVNDYIDHHIALSYKNCELQEMVEKLTENVEKLTQKLEDKT